MFKDDEGRLVVLLKNLFIRFGNVYAPNVEHPEFFLQLKKTLMDFGDYLIIMGGDFNQVLDVFLDRSGKSVPRVSKTQDAIKAVCKAVWRLLNLLLLFLK